MHGAYRRYERIAVAKVAELVDALVLGASGATRGSSSLPFRTTSPVRYGDGVGYNLVSRGAMARVISAYTGQARSALNN